jgi:hypothetical protein
VFAVALCVKSTFIISSHSHYEVRGLKEYRQ